MSAVLPSPAMSPAARPMSPNQRAWARFRRNRVGYWSLWGFVFVLVLATFAPDGPTACSGLPVARHDADALAARFAPAFVLETTEREVHRTPSGGDQAFTWAVLRRDPAAAPRR